MGWQSWGDFTNKAEEAYLPPGYRPGPATLRGGWVTVKQAAQMFNVTEREIMERYKPHMPAEAVLAPRKEREYTYDFEQITREDLESYNPEQSWTVDPFNRRWDTYPEQVIDDEDDTPPFPFMVTNEKTDQEYDQGLTPVSRRQVEYEGWLLKVSELLEVRIAKTSRAPLTQPRAQSGRFKKRPA